MCVFILMVGSEKIADSDLDLLSERFVNAIIREDRAASSIVVVGGDETERNYVFKKMQSEFERRGRKVDISEAVELERGDIRYSIDIGWYVDLIRRERKVPNL